MYYLLYIYELKFVQVTPSLTLDFWY